MNTSSTIKELLHEAEVLLTNSGNPRLDAEILLCKVMNLDRSRLYSSPENVLPEGTACEYRSLISKRQQGNPVAYLTGYREFWSMQLEVNEYTLIPRPETECLVEAALELIPANTALDIADLGTGSGAIACAIARERPQCKIVATDICEHALAMAVKNAARHGVHNIQFIRSDWFANLQAKFDIIISNPPYIRNSDPHLIGDGVTCEPRQALCGGEDGLDAIRNIIRNADKYLNRNGRLLIEHGYDQAQAVQLLMDESRFTDIKTGRDYSGVDRVTTGKRN
jgi:release factor glutamine methyltransferase